MRPSEKAAYWLMRAWTGLPSTSMVFVPGSRLTSVRKGLPSTCPPMMVCVTSLVGWSGLVIRVGWAKRGSVRSTRSFVGAVRRQEEPALPVVSSTTRTQALGSVRSAGPPPSPEHAPASSAAAVTGAPVSRMRRCVFMAAPFGRVTCPQSPAPPLNKR